MPTVDVAITVNGIVHRNSVEPRLLLVDYLRECLRLTGTKDACDTGSCGACTVLLNGSATKSCMVLAVQANGAEVKTIEGLADDGKLNDIQQAFLEQHAVQDGYEIPGLVMTATALLQKNPHPTEDEVRSGLDGNLARATGYENVVKAIQAVAARRSAGDTSAPVDTESLTPAAGELIGSSSMAVEAPAFLRGEAQFVGDIFLDGMVYASILHSPYAHARIKHIDTQTAKGMPGVVGVFTGTEVQVMPLPVVWVPTDVESHFPPHPSGQVPGSQSVLAHDTVRFIGQQVAVVVAETPEQADDALQTITVDYEPLPVVIDAEEAVKDGAPQLHESVPHNLVFEASIGDRDGTEQAISTAEVVIKQRVHNQRMLANTIETRGAVGSYNRDTGDFTLWTNVQPLYPVRLLISAYVLGIPYNKLRVIAPHIGGSHGSKGYLYADAPLVLWLSRELGRPVKWIQSRRESASTTTQGRDHTAYVTLAGTKDGAISAISVRSFSNIGAYPVINAPGQPRTLIGRSITGPYAIPHAYYDVSVVMTNTVQVGPLRGSGRSEATFLLERVVDQYAREIGMDPAEVRRKNMIAKDAFPYDNGMGWTYDSGDYRAALDQALEMVGYPDFAERKAEARARGKRLGVGISSFVAVAGVGPSAKMGKEGLVSGTWGAAFMAVQPTGEVTVTTGAQPHGQSQETTFAQIAAQGLGVGLEQVRIRHSDTEGSLFYGQTSYGSRSMSIEGTAVYLAAQKIKEKALKFAAHLFHANIEDVAYDSGKFFLKAAPDTAVVTLQQVAFNLWLGWDLPEGMDPGLQVTAYFNPREFNFPYGTHVAVVEVDVATGIVEVVRYIAVNDFGNVINPAVVDGQTHGNIVLGIGQALSEEAIYDADGRIVNDSLSTYAMPKASWLPTFELGRLTTPSPTNPLGVKGAGDVSNPPVAPAIVNAVCDALAEFGVKHIEMPLRPNKVWDAITATSSEAP